MEKERGNDGGREGMSVKQESEGMDAAERGRERGNGFEKTGMQ